MKKMICVVLSLLIMVTCCFSALAENKTITIGLSRVSGKKGEVVFVDFSLLTANSRVAAMDLQFAYDTEKMALTEYPKSAEGNCYKPGATYFSDPLTSYFIFNAESLTASLVEVDGFDHEGVLGTLAFVLKQDVEIPSSLVSVKGVSAIDMSGNGYTFQYVNNADYIFKAPDNTVIFSMDEVSGKAGETVVVSLHLLKEYAQIGALELLLGYDTGKLELVEHPNGAPGTYFEPGNVLTNGNALYAFGIKGCLLSLASDKGLNKSGVIGSFAFRLLEDIPESTVYTACRMQLITHKNDTPYPYPVLFFNNCPTATFKSGDSVEPVENDITFALGEGRGSVGSVARVGISLNEGKAYLKEFQLQITYDATKLQLKGFEKGTLLQYNQGNGDYTLDLETGILTVHCQKNIMQAGKIGDLVFKVLDVTPTELPIEVSGGVIGNPVHAIIPNFVYDASVTHGGVLVLYSKFFHNITENGAVLEEYEGTTTNVSVPAFTEEGVPVVEIGEKAFANHNRIKQVTIPNYVTKIAEDAFEYCDKNLIIFCGANSAAELYARKKGFKIENFVSAEIVTSTDAFALGDLNKDTMINAKDALLVLQIAVQKYQPSAPAQVVAGDVNKDEKANAKDALEILKKAVGKPACF